MSVKEEGLREKNVILMVKFFDFAKSAAMGWGLNFANYFRIVNERQVPL